jgi:6,7-dimethyl-8-ribityllumazine synthase
MELSVGIVASRFNQHVVDELLDACLAQLEKEGISKNNIDLESVPGALEIPVVLDMMALKKKYHVLIAIGAVIRGETYHFEVVSDQSAQGLLQVQLNHHIPIINGIITTNDDDQAFARTKIKGAEAAIAAIKMAHLAEKLSGHVLK